METNTCQCQECARKEKEHRESEELNFAILLALVPVLTITLFSNMGLIS